MGRRDLGEPLARAALGLVVPAVGERPHAVDAERCRDVAGDRIGVDEQHVVAASTLEDRREVRRDRRLADAALGVEHDEDGRPGAPALGLDRAALQDGPDPSSTVWLRMHIASTRQRSDSAEYGRVKYSSSTPLPPASSRASARSDTTIKAGIGWPFSRSSE